MPKNFFHLFLLGHFNSFQDASLRCERGGRVRWKNFNSFQDASAIGAGVGLAGGLISIPSRMLLYEIDIPLNYMEYAFQFLLGCFVVAVMMVQVLQPASFNSFQDASELHFTLDRANKETFQFLLGCFVILAGNYNIMPRSTFNSFQDASTKKLKQLDSRQYNTFNSFQDASKTAYKGGIVS